MNNGQSDYEVSAAEIIDANGDFSILIPPKKVTLGRSGFLGQIRGGVLGRHARKWHRSLVRRHPSR